MDGFSSSISANSGTISGTLNQSELMEEETNMELRRGPWTVEEDLQLMNYIANHGEGRWNLLAQGAGLKRTGKSCRLRWLNYLRPDVRRGNITLEEQLKILELHTRWGNRWSKIAQHLPGRTDNEIKNYWRTRVQKHAKQLRCDVNSKLFKDTMRYIWMPRLVERIQAQRGSTTTTTTTLEALPPLCGAADDGGNRSYTPDENSSTAASSDSMGTSQMSMLSDFTAETSSTNSHGMQVQHSSQIGHGGYQQRLTSPYGYADHGHGLGSNQGGQLEGDMWLGSSEGVWSDEEIWLLQQHYLSYGL
ncbi:hypothetical protein Sjap_007003 [Stephania japonica]|uniref:Uncharacterized protein n=1 Tax=Stephania japonica TaxID=461633 RepID=A0AAP0PMH1_9MAGN